mmetsp:Transcript_27504/g.107700  ORF Transcript_27504/g.107700 Transcript_27504/m.107700 type:complete len:655 (-) Transcript_27504:2414-4378(-)
MSQYVTSPPGEISWPPSVTNLFLEGPVSIPTVDAYVWIVVLAGLVSFVMAWGIGANDVANAFATSVGSGAITLFWACVIAAVMESAGALLLGARVTSTVRSKILRVPLYDPNFAEGVLNGPELLMVSFFVALIAATSWLILATSKALPVSTTHSIVGALIGVGLSFGGPDAVIWIGTGEGLEKMSGVVGIIVAWILSPVLSGIIGLSFFLFVRFTVFRRKNPVRSGFLFRPLFYGVASALVVFFIIFKGPFDENVNSKLDTGMVVSIAIGVGFAAAAVTWFILNPLLRKNLIRWENQMRMEIHQATDFEHQSKVMSVLRKVGVNVVVEEELSDEIKALHDNVEVFDEKTEKLFSWVQVFTASFDSFAHGANDVANAAAPFASIISLYENDGALSERREVDQFDADGTFQGGDYDGESYGRNDLVPNANTFCGTNGTSFGEGTSFYQCLETARFAYLQPNQSNDPTVFSVYDSSGVATGEEATCYSDCNPGNYYSYVEKDQTVQWWILIIAAAGIVVGLFMWGYRVIIAIGEKLTKLTPSRGFAIEIGASFTVLIASSLGLPVSTTHCQVGATMGVGLAEFRGNTVNWRQFVYIFIGWGITLLFTGFVGYSIFSFVVYSPLKFANPQMLSYCPGQQTFLLQSDGGVNGVVCSGMT